MNKKSEPEPESDESIEAEDLEDNFQDFQDDEFEEERDRGSEKEESDSDTEQNDKETGEVGWTGKESLDVVPTGISTGNVTRLSLDSQVHTMDVSSVRHPLALTAAPAVVPVTHVRALTPLRRQGRSLYKIMGNF